LAPPKRFVGVPNQSALAHKSGHFRETEHNFSQKFQ
jgi:hypothetical protein